MTYPAEPDLSQVCPHLGLGDDADSHATYATEAHRCYRMPSPTRIALNHQESFCLLAAHTTCPIFTGEGIAQVGPAAAAAATASAVPTRPAASAEPAATVSGPPPGTPQRPGERSRPAAPAGPRPRRPGAQEGQLRARPRAGGISMPAATIGLFALAIVLIGIAFLITQAVDDDGGSALSEADKFATQNAGRTTTPAQTQTQAAANQTPGATGTQGNQTPGATRTGTTTPGSGAGTYTVQAGDLCGTIAETNNLTLQQLLSLNNMQESDCNNLQVGQVLKVR